MVSSGAHGIYSGCNLKNDGESNVWIVNPCNIGMKNTFFFWFSVRYCSSYAASVADDLLLTRLSFREIWNRTSQRYVCCLQPCASFLGCVRSTLEVSCLDTPKESVLHATLTRLVFRLLFVTWGYQVIRPFLRRQLSCIFSISFALGKR